MKFSFRYFLASIIFVCIIALVITQVRFRMQTQNIPFSQALIHTVNPFPITPIPWEKEQNSSFSFPITLKNTSEKEIVPQGKIFLHESPGSEFYKIAIQNAELIDFLPINPEKITLLPGETKIISQEWQGFGEKYIDEITGIPKIAFQSPSQFYSIPTIKHASFFEKIIPKKSFQHIALRFEIDLPGIENLSNASIAIPIFTLETELNSGLIITILGILGLFMILWKFFSPREADIDEILQKRQNELQLEMENFEKMAQETVKKIEEKQKKPPKKHSSRHSK